MSFRGLVTRPAGIVVLVVLVGAAAATLAGLAGATSQPLVQTTATMRALAAPFFLAAGVLRLARWRITGEAHCALRGGAMLLMGGLALPSTSLARTLSAPDASL